MKQFFSYLGASLAAIAALASCNKELEAPVEDLKGGVPFEICASTADTKTAMNDDWTSRWVANDAINLFHAVAGSTTYKSDAQFTITAENLDANKFTGTLSEKLTADSYDWYAIYPYKEKISSPGEQTNGYVYIGHSIAATQNGNNSKAHLCTTLCPLYGVSKSVEATSPVSLEMKHLTSVVEINVTNSNDEPLMVSNISISTDEDIVGSYYINFAGETVEYNPSNANNVKTVAKLTVQDGTALAKGETASFYIPIKPHVAENGSVITITVNGYEKTISLTKDVTFTAGKIKKINFNVDKVVVDYVTLPWTEDFSGDLGIYTLVDGGTTTMTYNANLAKGTTPELLVAKGKGSFSTKVKATAVDAILTFKSNHPDYLEISVDNDNIALSKVSNTEYNLSIPSGVEFFNLTFTNNNTENTRLDDISLVVDKRTALKTPYVLAELNKDNDAVTNSITVMWAPVANAGSYEVMATPTKGATVKNTVTADGSETYEYTITGLAYETEYTISVVAKPSDTGQYKDSATGICEDKVKTGTKPLNGGTTTLGDSWQSKSFYNMGADFTNGKTGVDLADTDQTSLSWNISKGSATGIVAAGDKDRGVQLQKNGGILLTTTNYSGGVNKIVLNMSKSSKGPSFPTVTITVDGKSFTTTSTSFTTTATEYEFTCPEGIVDATGKTISISVTSSASSSYVKYVKINPAK